ncbi:MAG TPA: ComF family protein [Candidatus Kryptonia bacterium]
MKPTDGLSRIAESFVNFVYPPSCTTCSRDLKRGEFYICSRCWDSFERVARTETIIQGIEEKFLRDESIDAMDAVFLFGDDSRVRTAVHLLKYNGAEAIAKRFGVLIAAKIAADVKMSSCEVIAPVPLHSARERERGYNQSELITRSVACELRVLHLPRLLKRTRQTQTQTLFDAEGRRRNIAGAFTVDDRLANRVAGRKILLVDDVITTGSTIRECAGELKKGGASEIYAASAAITV